jgi:phage tail P2-like protein
MNVYDFFPEDLQAEPLFDQVLYLLQNFVIANTELDQRDSVQKYIDFSKISTDLLPKIVSEMGYKYITDVLELNTSRLLQVMSMMALIHALKGTLTGLNFVLNLLGFTGSIITEWWQKSPVGAPDTFDLVLDIDIQGLSSDALPRFLTFLRNYVYPTLNSLTLISTSFALQGYALGLFGDQEFAGSISA